MARIITHNNLQSVPVTWGVPQNREQFRKLKMENARNFPKFMEIEEEFVDELFSDTPWDYKTLYEEYLSKWQRTIDRMKAFRCFKYTQPNEHYFAEKFFPIEAAA